MLELRVESGEVVEAEVVVDRCVFDIMLVCLNGIVSQMTALWNVLNLGVVGR